MGSKNVSSSSDTKDVYKIILNKQLYSKSKVQEFVENVFYIITDDEVRIILYLITVGM